MAPWKERRLDVINPIWLLHNLSVPTQQLVLALFYVTLEKWQTPSLHRHLLLRRPRRGVPPVMAPVLPGFALRDIPVHVCKSSPPSQYPTCLRALES